LTADEGSWVWNGGTVVDPDGVVTEVWPSVGSLSFDGVNWEWVGVPPDGPSVSRWVRIWAVDNGGETSVVRFWLGVNNVSPEVGALQLPPSPVRADDIFILTNIFTDPYSLDPRVAVVFWGDNTQCRTDRDAGCSLQLGRQLDDGVSSPGSVTASHSYTDAGTYTIQLSVTDKDGGTGTSTAQVVVVDQPIQ
jgi:hypothetical protein